MFVAVSMLARYVVRPVTRVLGWPLERLAGTTGRLARENAMRNPAGPPDCGRADDRPRARGLRRRLRQRGSRTATLGRPARSAATSSCRARRSCRCRRMWSRSSRPIPASRSSRRSARRRPPRRRRLAQVSEIVPSTFSRVWKTKWDSGSDATYASLGGRERVVDRASPRVTTSTSGARSRSRRARAARPPTPCEGSTTRDNST